MRAPARPVQVLASRVRVPRLSVPEPGASASAGSGSESAAHLHPSGPAVGRGRAWAPWHGTDGATEGQRAAGDGQSQGYSPGWRRGGGSGTRPPLRCAPWQLPADVADGPSAEQDSPKVPKCPLRTLSPYVDGRGEGEGASFPPVPGTCTPGACVPQPSPGASVGPAWLSPPAAPGGPPPGLGGPPPRNCPGLLAGPSAPP